MKGEPSRVAALAATLSPLTRLALAYAPRTARPAWLAVLALDQRLAGIVRSAREPLLAQIKLAWWRERLAEPVARWPQGEPLLSALAAWDGQAAALVALVAGWEAVLVGNGPIEADIAALVDRKSVV